MLTNFVETPQKLRGTPVQLRLRLTRSFWHSPDPNNPAGVSRIFLKAGVTPDESRTNPYCVVFADRPGEMPIGPHISEDVTLLPRLFHSNLVPDEAGDEKHRSAPLLIGRLEWHPTHSAGKHPSRASSWLWPGIMGGMLLLVVPFFAWRRYARRTGSFRRTRSIPDKTNWFLASTARSLGESCNESRTVTRSRERFLGLKPHFFASIFATTMRCHVPCTMGGYA